MASYQREEKHSSKQYKKQNYWTTYSNPPPYSPWYAWDVQNTKKITNKHEDNNRIGKLFRSDLRDYLMTSTLHGLRYIGEKKLTWCERFFWLFAFGCSVTSAAFFILNVYEKWRLSPMIVSINPESMSLYNLPFPALTICNVNQAKKSVAEKYKQIGSSLDQKLLESLCSSEYDTAFFENDIAESADWDHTRAFLINVTQPCNEMLAHCMWNSNNVSCVDLFNAQLTDEGLCCTFNVVHRELMFKNPKVLNDLNLTFPLPAVDWTPEGGFPPDAPPNGFPWRPKGVGSQHGLTLILDSNLAEYYCATTLSHGFKILMHNPTETPKIANLGEIYGPGFEVRVAIQPKILDAQPALRTIDVSKRLCFFSGEKKLIFYRTYTMKNCEMECQAQNMWEKCNCVLYYMPKNKWTRVCGKADAKCYTQLSKHSVTELEKACDECLPACTEISFEEQISSAPLGKSLVKVYAKKFVNKTPEYFIENMLVIHYYFDENSFLRYTKGEIFGLTEFLSNTGGLLGLCMGFSIMSAVELLYYITLRALCMARRRHSHPTHPFTE